MAGYSAEQIQDLRALADRLFRRLDRIRQIAQEHESCECSAALMILEVLDRG